MDREGAEKAGSCTVAEGKSQQGTGGWQGRIPAIVENVKGVRKNSKARSPETEGRTPGREGDTSFFDATGGLRCLIYIDTISRSLEEVQPCRTRAVYWF